MTERDYGVEAQRAAEKHLTAVWEWFHDEQDGEPMEQTALENPACAPFCGCLTCEVREVLHAAWPIIEEGVANGDLTQDDVAEAGTHE